MMNGATEVLMALAGFVWLASLKTVVLIAAVLLLQKLCGSALSATGRYLLWLPVVTSLLMPLGFETAVPLSSVVALPDPAAVVSGTAIEPLEADAVPRNANPAA